MRGTARNANLRKKRTVMTDEETKHIDEIPTLDDLSGSELGEAVEPTEEMKKEAERPRFEMREVFLFVTKDVNGDEGTAAVVNPNGQVIPLIAFDAAKTEQMMPAAQEIANQSKQALTVVRLFNREELGTIEPKMVQPAPDAVSMSASNLRTKEDD
jgi:hypothetical protein